MSDHDSKTFDSVRHMRETRDGISAQTVGMTYDELIKWLRDHRYTDPVLQRLADRAARQADAAEHPAGR